MTLQPAPSPAAFTHRPKSWQAADICKRGDVVKNRWEVMEKLGAGTFGQVYKVLDLKTGHSWALKVESKKARKPVLRMDVAISRALNGKTHFANFFACGHEELFSYMISELLGKNLATRKRTSQEGKLPLRTVIRIGIQTLIALRELHESGFLHRDIKPSNLATGVGEREGVIYLLDFGLARKYLDEKNRIYPPRPKVNFRGTVRYAAIKAHMQQELSRVDELWSLLYSLIDLHIGHLPWHKIRDMKKVGEAKMMTSCEVLCQGMPQTWRRFYALCSELSYDSVPNYDYLIHLINVVGAGKHNLIDMKVLTAPMWEWDYPVAESKDPGAGWPSDSG